MSTAQITIKVIAEDDPMQTEFKYRPRVSAKIRAYLVDLVLQKVLEPKNIIVGSKHVYRLTFSLESNIDSKRPDRVLWDLKTIMGKKVISISTYYKSVSKDMTPRAYTHMLFDGLKTFITEKYKKVTADEMEAVRQQIDWAYIESLPFPAPFEEQQYILDANPNVAAAYRQQFGG